MTAELEPAVTTADLPSTQGVIDLSGQSVFATPVTIYYIQDEQDESSVTVQDESNVDCQCELDAGSGNLGEI